MAKPLRLEFAGALYHVTSRGDRREDVFVNDEDRYDWLEVLSGTCMRFNWVVHAFWPDGQPLPPVEPVFSNLRHNKRLNRLTLRGKAKVNTQWHLYCLVHNIEKLANNAYQ